MLLLTGREGELVVDDKWLSGACLSSPGHLSFSRVFIKRCQLFCQHTSGSLQWVSLFGLIDRD